MIKFEINWLEDGSCSNTEEKATWAEFSLQLFENQVFRHQDLLSGEIRNAQSLHLIDIANWLTGNFWFFLGEVQNPELDSSIEYQFRHRFRFASQGFPLPNLEFYSVGEKILVLCKPHEVVPAFVKYLGTFQYLVSREEFGSWAQRFLDRIDDRLASMGIVDSEFQQRWNEIKSTTECDEIEFCLAAAAIGQDPYDLDDLTAKNLEQAGRLLPIAIRAEFFSAIGSKFSAANARLIANKIKNLSGIENPPKIIKRKKAVFELFVSANMKPWEEGYALAKELRRTTRIKVQEGVEFERVLEIFGLQEPKDLSLNFFDLNGASDRIDAIITESRHHSPVCAFSKRHMNDSQLVREESTKFAICRAVFGFLSSPEHQAIVTNTHTIVQKRNRAFAAEFLAPADGIRSKLSGKDVVTEGTIQDLAHHYRVSDIVIRHQLVNHRLAKIAETVL